MGLGLNGMNRRDFMKLAGAGTGLAALGAMAGPIIDRAAAADPNGSGSLADIEHFVFLMQENRSFDHYFGTMSSVRGFGDKTGAFKQYGYDAKARKADNSKAIYPYHLDTTKPLSNDGECITDPTHDWGPQHQAWNHGRMDQWVKVHVANDGADAGPNTMGYYEKADIPVHWALADAFTVCDHYFCSVLGPTDPNRLYWISGTIDPEGKNGGPLLYTPSQIPTNKYSWETYPEALQKAGVSWKVYADQTFGPVSQAVLSGMLQSFKNFQDPTSDLYARGIRPSFPANFKADVAADTLPSVSWIIPNLLTCEHPALPPAFGAQGILQVLDILTSNQKVWEKTALIISYDENGGFFDHVPPPTAPPGTTGEYVSVKPLSNVMDSAGITGPIGLGFRVPALVVSPFSRGGLVASEVFDHTSQLQLVAKRFGVPVPNVSAWRRKTVGDMTSAFDFATTPSTKFALEARDTTGAARAVAECHVGIDGVSGTFLSGKLGGNYPPPTGGAVPAQATSPKRRHPSGVVAHTTTTSASHPSTTSSPNSSGAGGGTTHQPGTAKDLPVAVSRTKQTRVAQYAPAVAVPEAVNAGGAPQPGDNDPARTALGVSAAVAAGAVAVAAAASKKKRDEADTATD